MKTALKFLSEIIKRRLGRPRPRWEDKIKRKLKEI
jgi:hypothetical protein